MSRAAIGIALLVGLGVALSVSASHRPSDIASTKHNLSATSGPAGRTVQATTESEICVFCHTPHAATSVPGAPLWNRGASVESYTPYASSSIQATIDVLSYGQGGTSKMCLSCHDGSIAIGAVSNAPGPGPGSGITVTGSGVTAQGRLTTTGAQTGFTRNLGTDLSNDHPISLTYDAALPGNDPEIRPPGGGTGQAPTMERNSSVDSTHKLPLEGGQIQCATCHDPHVVGTELGSTAIKFLRLNRFQLATPASGFDPVNDQICIGCHDKGVEGWADSIHARSTNTNQTYKDAAATTREFPTGIQVWQAACLNCHDTHTVQGARRLLREGTDAVGSPKSGGNPEIQEVCYQCHTTAAASIIDQAAGAVPDIRTDFATVGNFTMPITAAQQSAGAEVHDVTDADLSETTTLLGKGGNLVNRHAECTDCHNPHRVRRSQVFHAQPGTLITNPSTHSHASGHSNIISGALRGAWGVEPVYGSASFDALPSSYTVKKGDPGTSTVETVGSSYVTREYQICLKCHSDYAYDDNNLPDGTSNRPPVPYAVTCAVNANPPTVSTSNCLERYTNQAREFQSPTTHRGNPAGGTTDSGASAAYQLDNHRSWHPVMNSTGRSAAARNANAAAWIAPFNGATGTQTMYCSDCHGSDSATNQPAAGRPWGPHGSVNPFILRAPWTASVGENSDGLCFRCHVQGQYASDAQTGAGSGFDTNEGDGHAIHSRRGRLGEDMRCRWCHVMVPHGWKNKSFLVNLNDVGPEAVCRQGDIDDGVPCTLGQPHAPGTEVRTGGGPNPGGLSWADRGYTNPPYYVGAILKIRRFRLSNAQWVAADCGSSGQNGGNGTSGLAWMESGNEACRNPN